MRIKFLETKTGKYNILVTQIFGLDYFIPHLSWYLLVNEKYPREFFFSVSNMAVRLDFSDLAKKFQI